MAKLKQIVVSSTIGDRIKGEDVYRDKESVLRYIEYGGNNIGTIYCTDPKALSIDIFNQGFDFILVDSFESYSRIDKCNRLVRFYHNENGKVSLEWRAKKKTVRKDNVFVNNCIGRWMIDMFNITKKIKVA